MAGERLNPNYTDSDIYLADNLTYHGRDLTKVFASEITDGDPWNWIQGRINTANWSGLRIGDYIPLTVNSESHEAQIAGIDTFYDTGGSETHGSSNTSSLAPVPHHIDFITRDCLKTTYQWNTTDTNAGTGDGSVDDGTDCPWLTSEIHKSLNGSDGSSGVYATLDEKLKPHITNKVGLLERRAKKSLGLTASTGWHWYDMGKLWLPTEWEVFGSTVWATEGYGNAQTVQYPIFANSWRSRIKGNGPGGARSAWWLASVSGRGATDACGVSSNGFAYNWGASNRFYAPVCFRIAAKSS